MQHEKTKSDLNVTITDFIMEDEKIWFASADCNELLEADLKTDRIRQHGTFPGEKRIQNELFSSVAKYKSKLIFAPRSAKEIAIYDLNAKEFTKIPLPERKYSFRGNLRFTLVTVYGHCAFFLPSEYSAILKLDLTTMQLIIIDEWYEKLRTDGNNVAGISEHGYWVEEYHIFFLGYAFQDQKAQISRSVLGILNMKTGEVELKDLDKNGKYSAICAKDNCVYAAGFVENSARIIEWNRKTDKISYYDQLQLKSTNRDSWNLFVGSGRTEQTLYFILNNVIEMLKFDLATHQPGTETLPFDSQEEELTTGLYDLRRINTLKIIESRMFYQDAYNNIFYEYDLEKKMLVKHKFNVDLSGVMNDISGETLSEGRMGIGLEEYLNMVAELAEAKNMSKNLTGNAVYQTIAAIIP